MPARPSTNQGYASYLETLVDLRGDSLNSDQKDFDSSSRVFEGVTAWLESVYSEELISRDLHCRSDSCIDGCYTSHLALSPDSLIARPQSVSAPEMASQRDNDGFKVPSLPASATSSRKRRASAAMSATSDAVSSSSLVSSQTSSRSMVEKFAYRYSNLARNNIAIRLPHEAMPQDIVYLVSEITRPRSDSGKGGGDRGVLSPEIANKLARFESENVGESAIETYMNSVFFGNMTAEYLYQLYRQVMGRHTVPHVSGRADIRVSTPVPDLLCGYTRIEAFANQAIQLDDLGLEPSAYQADMIYPFLVVEYKGTSGNMWVATNQCAGGSVACTNMIDGLNARLAGRAVSNASFSIAMNGTEARLYVTWKEKDHFYMQKIRGFLLQDVEHFELLHRYIDNIMDWGLGIRLQSIQSALETL